MQGNRKSLFYFCIDINHFYTNNSISYKTQCFLTKKLETENTILVFEISMLYFTAIKTFKNFFVNALS